MQKTTLWRQAGLVCLALSITIISCQKDKDDTADRTKAVELATGSAASKAAYDDVIDVVLQDGEANGLGGRSASCATVTVTPSTPGVFPKTMTIDFGSGCTGPGGVTRKGKIIAVFSNRIHIAGATVAISFDNYYVNNFKVEGNVTFTNNGGTGLNFSRQVSNGKLTYPDGTTYYNYTGSHTLSQTAGAGTLTFVDDEFSITGNGTTTSSAGNSLAVTITTPLLKKNSCHNVSGGVEQFTYNTISGSLNFGDGTCDNQALVTIGSFTFPITLP